MLKLKIVPEIASSLLRHFHLPTIKRPLLITSGLILDQCRYRSPAVSQPRAKSFCNLPHGRVRSFTKRCRSLSPVRHKAMMRLANGSRVTMALLSVARVLPDPRRTSHAVSNADANVLVASGSNAGSLRTGRISIAALVGACVVSPTCGKR
jgi:hypothetical protein